MGKSNFSLLPNLENAFKTFLWPMYLYSSSSNNKDLAYDLDEFDPTLETPFLVAFSKALKHASILCLLTCIIYKTYKVILFIIPSPCLGGTINPPSLYILPLVPTPYALL